METEITHDPDTFQSQILSNGCSGPCASTPGPLMPLHKKVIALSRKDPAWSVKPKAWPTRWLRGWTSEALPLADPMLEALRRYAILRRIHGMALAAGERAQLRDAGFSQAAIDEVDILLRPHLTNDVPETGIN